MSVKSKKTVFTCSDALFPPEKSGAPRGVWGSTTPFKVKCSKLCKCSTGTCCYFKTAVTEFASHHTEAKAAGLVVVRDIVISAGKGGSRESVGDASPYLPF